MTLVVVLMAACGPQTISDLADADRCFGYAEEGMPSEVYDDLAELADIPRGTIDSFLASPAYSANPQAWDWSLCLSRFGWICEGGSGVGTLNPTPPTQCVSQGETLQRVHGNPFLP
jgi:hypothetical protein